MRYKLALNLVLIALGCVGIARFCHHETRGFSRSKIEGNLAMAPEIAIASDPAVEQLLNQKFYYFSRGKQSFAFLSEDGKYVLKLFNNTYQRKLQWLKIAQSIPFLSSWAKERTTYFQSKIDRTFYSYQIAFEKMPEQTALCYAHLGASSYLPGRVTIVDPLHIAHELDPNKIGFLLQKRVDLAYPYLKTRIERGEIAEARQGIASLVELFFWKYRHAIADNDPLIRTNYGFLEGKAVQIDVGPLSIDNSFKDNDLQKKESARVLASLKSWLEKNGPELIAFLDEELGRQLSWSNEENAHPLLSPCPLSGDPAADRAEDPRLLPAEDLR